MPSINNISPDCLKIIFKYLPIEDQCFLSWVCKYWQYIHQIKYHLSLLSIMRTSLENKHYDRCDLIIIHHHTLLTKYTNTLSLNDYLYDRFFNSQGTSYVLKCLLKKLVSDNMSKDNRLNEFATTYIKKRIYRRICSFLS